VVKARPSKIGKTLPQIKDALYQIKLFSKNNSAKSIEPLSSFAQRPLG
jgi:hypothetical protein